MFWGLEIMNGSKLKLSFFLSLYIFSLSINSLADELEFNKGRCIRTSALCAGASFAFIFGMIVVTKSKSASHSYIDDPSQFSDEPTSKPSQEPSFMIKLMNMGINHEYDTIFEDAKNRWERMITNDLEDISPSEFGITDVFHNLFEGRSYNEAIDDLMIAYSIEAIDGKHGLWGVSGPTIARKNFSSAVAGVVILDELDLKSFSEEDAEAIVTQQIGHVLGIGTFWDHKCATGCMVRDYTYNCSRAHEEYDKIGFTTDTYNYLDVNIGLSIENEWEGESCEFWEETSFYNSSFDSSKDVIGYSEIMSAFFESHKYQLLSSVSAGALEDLGGYEIDYSQTDTFGQLPNQDETHGFQTRLIKPTSTFVVFGRMLRPKLIELK